MCVCVYVCMNNEIQQSTLIHCAGGERKAWYRYSDNVGSRNPWVNKLFANFREEAVRLRSVCDQSELLAGLPSSNSAPSLLAVQPVGGAPPGGGGGGGRQRNLAPGMSHSGNSSPGKRPK